MASKPDVVTYSLGGKMVFVTPARNYEEALDFAQNIFEDELRHIDRGRISFSVIVMSQKVRRSVRIDKRAWAPVVSGLKEFEVINVDIQPENGSLAPPPDYRKSGSFEVSGDGAEQIGRSRSAPVSRTGSRGSSPAAPAKNGTKSSGSSKGGRAKWLKLR